MPPPPLVSRRVIKTLLDVINQSFNHLHKCHAIETALLHVSLESFEYSPGLIVACVAFNIIEDFMSNFCFHGYSLVERKKRK